jgi:hypothetical protein
MGQIWELDFYSRPVVDEHQKKRWELLVCESPQRLQAPAEPGFRYSQFCSSTEVNSVWIRGALEKALSEVDYKPDKIRFFRQPLATMIQKACAELEIPAYLSRRTYALQRWIQDRLETVYPTYEGYQPATVPTLNLPATNPQPLPDALKGQQWAFANLGIQELEGLAGATVDFGEVFPPKMMGLSEQDTLPGLVIFSERALPLAAWMSGLDLAALQLDLQPTPALSKAPAHRLILETGGSDRWILATFRDIKTLAEAQNFEAAKKTVQNVHFLAVQSNTATADVVGFWLLQDARFE